MKKNILIPLAAILALTACEKQINIDAEDMEPVVVVYSKSDMGENAQVEITMSRPIFGFHSNDYGEFPKVENATARLTAGGTVYDATRESNRYSFAYQPQPGDELQLHVEVPDHDPLTASTIVPRTPQISNAYFTHEEDNYDNTETYLHFTLHDPTGEENYYAFELRVIKDYSRSEYPYIDTTLVYLQLSDPLLVDNDMSTIFEFEPGETASISGQTLCVGDAHIDGSNHSIKVRVFEYFGDNEYVTTTCDLFIYGISREEYHQRLVTSQMSDFDEIINFFSEPQQVPTNIVGGAGLFSFKSVATINVPTTE